MEGRTSPMKTKGKSEGGRGTTKQLKSTSTSGEEGQKTQGRRALQPPLHIRVAQNKAKPPVTENAKPPEVPRRSRSNPSYSATPSLKPLLSTLKHSGELSPVQQAKAPTKRSNIHHSQSVPTTTTSTLDPAKQKLVERATKARLYFLRKSGPSRFIIGGDSPESRFYVTIGPQTCTCSKSPCIHILFVMLRVFKLSQNDPNLWRKPLLNYEAEALVKDFQARISQRTMPRKSSKKTLSIDRAESVPNDPSTPGLAESSPGSVDMFSEHPNGESQGEDVMATVRRRLWTQGDENYRSPALPIPAALKGEQVSVDGSSDGGRSEGEEEVVCPICLNELDEGEDLLVCGGCHNQLHQHCMDVWAVEQNKKKEDVYCPVCRTPWAYSAPTPQSLVSPPPVAREMSSSTSPGHLVLNDDKQALFESLKSMFGAGAAEEVFSPDWRHRESALMVLARESISYLLPHVTAKFQSRRKSTDEGQSARAVQEVCMEVVAHACNDSVLKVFLAALELLRVILGYSLCYNASEANNLQQLLKPVLPVLLTRCADAQRRVKECSIDTVCNLCLGQEGPLSVGSSCGHQTSCGVSNVRLVLTVALTINTDKRYPYNWWLGRLILMDKMLCRFSWEFLLPQCMLKPLSPNPLMNSDSDTDESYSNTVSPEDSFTSTVSNLMHDTGSAPESGDFSTKSETDDTGIMFNTPSQEPTSPIVKNNLLMQCWYFAAKATHIPHNKVAKAARRVIVKISKTLRDDPSSLEIIHDVISKCHRSSAEGLLDKVLHAREKPQESLVPQKQNSVSEHKELKPRRLHTPGQPIIPSGQFLSPPGNLSREVSNESDISVLSDVDVESSLQTVTPRYRRTSSPQRVEFDSGELEIPNEKLDFSEDCSEDSFQSAVSDLDKTILEEDQTQSKGSSDNLSSTSNSHDSKSDDKLRTESQSSVASGSGDVTKRPKNGSKRQPYYNRQSTNDSAIGSEFDNSSLDSATMAGMFPCKDNIEKEEAEALAKVRSMAMEDAPHPSLSNLVPPTEEVLVYVQNTVGKESSENTDGFDVRPYIEGVHWKKGKVIGTGAFCTCHLARDLENGTMFAVKQVSYVRNTKEQEEVELTRLREEIAMLGRLSHSNIVRCLGATQHDGHINIFVEWMAGGCLDNILSEFGPLKESVICLYTRQICLGIAYLHEHYVIHRDLKGGNILLDSTGRRIRIADFGSSARLAANTTAPGEFQDMEGTVAFMAPEVVRGGTYEDSAQPMGYGRKCDVWSIGCVIVQMATARPPWVGSSNVQNKYQLIFKIGQATAPPPLPSFNNPALKDLTIRCMEVNPNDRPNSSDLLKHPLFTESLEKIK